MCLKKMMVMLLLVSQLIPMCWASKLIRITNFVGIDTKILLACTSDDVETEAKYLPPLASFEFKASSTKNIRCNTRSGTHYYSFEIFNARRSQFEENCWVFKSSGPCLCDCTNAKCTYNEECYEWETHRNLS
ncbi:LOW QUALITY PROTEIN: Self-incompatibility protein [Trema orientale]|uniref:Self-incompatibility protein n=1 Tax=Trema orientale TaxID=63057 RepID=A0A2P5C762_TREOI|nr:LOW QUALITY PROTEIN: Self-incompatibility protein [Trema orientale]